MKVNKRKPYTVQEFTEILRLKEKRWTNSEIGREFNRTSVAIGSVLVLHSMFLKGKMPPSKPLQKVFEKTGQLKPLYDYSRLMSEPEEEQKNSPEYDLETATNHFQDAIANYVVAEVKMRSEQAVAEKQKELDNLRDYYEKELQKLQTILVQAQDSSVVGLIKKKWSNGV